MHILAAILFFVFASILAAGDGDYSGVAAIGKVVGFLAVLFGFMWILSKPVILLIVIAIVVAIVVAAFISNRKEGR